MTKYRGEQSMQKAFVAMTMLLAVACGSDNSNNVAPKIGDPSGERAFKGSFVIGGTSGTCVVVVKPGGTATGTCATGSTAPLTARESTLAATNTVSLTGTFTASGSTGSGDLSISGAGWTITAEIGRVAFGQTVGVDTLSGTIVGPLGSGSMVAKDGTVSAVTALCGIFTGDDNGYFNVQTEAGSVDGTVNGLVVVGDGRSGVIQGTRTASGSIDMKAHDSAGTVAGSAAGTVSGTPPAVTDGTWVSATGSSKGTWTARECSGGLDFCCTGTSSSTKCCASTCPCP